MNYQTTNTPWADRVSLYLLFRQHGHWARKQQHGSHASLQYGSANSFVKAAEPSESEGEQVCFSLHFGVIIETGCLAHQELPDPQ